MTDGNDAAQEAQPLHTGIQLTPSSLREPPYAYAVASKEEPDPQMRRAYASVAYAFAQLGECIERRAKAE